MMPETRQRRRRRLLASPLLLLLAFLVPGPSTMTLTLGWLLPSQPPPSPAPRPLLLRAKTPSGLTRLLLSRQRDQEQEQQQLQQQLQRQALVVAAHDEEAATVASGAGAIVLSHAALMRSLCPSVERCRVYLPSDLLLLDDAGEVAGAASSSEWQLDEAALGRYLASCEPLEWPGKGGGSAVLLSRLSQEEEESNNDRPATALLVPLRADGWVAVELQDKPSIEEEEAAVLLTRLGPALDCLRTSLAVVGRERAADMRARGKLRGLLREMRAPLGALRTFGKLLLRRLEKTDTEGLNQELTANVLASSDALVAVLRRHGPGGEGGEDPGMTEEEEGASGGGWPLASGGDQQQGSSSSSASSSSLRAALCDAQAVLAPIVAAAKAISARDGVRFRCFVEEGLPPVRVDERGFQEALGLMIELALGSALAGAAAAAAEEDEGAGAAAAPPAVSLEVRSISSIPTAGPGGGAGGVTFVVRDNGLGDESVVRGGRELGRAREALERMGARLEIRRSVSLGGTHMAVMIGNG